MARDSPFHHAEDEAAIWPLLESVDEPEPQTEQPCLLGFHYLIVS